MSRKPFDPNLVSAAGESGQRATTPSLFDQAAAGPSRSEEACRRQTPDQIIPITVTQLVRRVKGALLEQLPGTIHLIGEVSDLSRPASGHIYMTLKDANCEVRAVMWRSAAKSVKFELSDGLEVLAAGSVDVYEPRGQVQFYIRRLQPRGQGALELAFRQLYERLKEEGLFDPVRKRKLPAYPQRIGVVTSGTGAAIRDIIQTLARRYPPAEVILLPVRVQGEGAAEEIAGAIARLNLLADKLGGIDLLIVGRGGGSLEDLWAFNEEMVARAIARSRLAVISAVGHEVDLTISDLVADLRAPTPTAAAELAVPHGDEVAELLGGLETRLRRSTGHILELAGGQLSRWERDELFRKPESLVNQGCQQVDEALAKLRWAPRQWLDRNRGLIDRYEAQVNRLRPTRLIGARSQRLLRLERMLAEAEIERFRGCERRLAGLGEALARGSPVRLAGRADEALRQLTVRLHQGASRRRAELAEQLDHLAGRLKASSHQSVLGRGYSLTRDKIGGRIIRSPREVQPGTVITTHLREGTIDSRVERTEDAEAGGA